MIAHRLSTIALADDIVVLEDGRDRRARHARRAARARPPLYAEIAAKGLPDQVFLNRKPIERGGGPVSAPPQPARRARAGAGARPAGAGASCAGCSSCCGPTAGASIADVRRRWCSRTAAALAPPPLAKLAIDDGITPGDTRDARPRSSSRSSPRALVYWGATYAQTYLVGWVGQRALQDLRIQLFAHLQTLSIGFYSRRQAGVIISRLTNDVQALDQLVSDGVVTLFGSSLTLIGTAVILFVLDASSRC